MKKRMMHLLLEYLKDSRRSDREIAKSMGVSQSTITRMRHRLVREGVIKEFSAIPDFTKMGHEIMAITFAKSKMNLSPEEIEKAASLVLANPKIIFLAEGEEMEKNGVMISMHKSFSDYNNFMTNLILETGDYMENLDTMVISLRGRIVKPLSPTYLGEQKET